MRIKFLNLKTENRIVKAACVKKISGIVGDSDFTLGSWVKKFESSFAKFCGAKYCIGVGSGTDALRTALLACGVGGDDEVITTPISYTSTSLAIAHCGARPVFVDVREDGNIDPTKIEEAITEKTKAILVVHMYGNICDMRAIKEIAKRRKLYLVDDCAHAHGAKYEGGMAGSLADISCFSFYPTKNLGAWGDAGAVTTSDEKLYEKASLFKNYGEEHQNYSKVIGFNSKLDTLQAVALFEKLRYLKIWNDRRFAIASQYTKSLGGLGDLWLIPLSRSCSYYNFPIKTSRRDALIKFLNSKGIETFIRYPLPIHLQECFAYLNYKEGDFPVAEKHAKSVLSLPFYPFLPTRHQSIVIKAIADFYKNK